jgi:hypothetical protein|tara:strand:- start:530 stop:655 length:126 start_codon:yes stop_codon:yes gene_type:complete
MGRLFKIRRKLNKKPSKKVRIVRNRFSDILAPGKKRTTRIS